MSGESDFDFFIGNWSIVHRRLKSRLTNCEEWEHFLGTTATRKTLGGMGNCDDNYLELPDGHYYAMTLRTFDPVKKKWSIWWLDGRHPGSLDAPMVGEFIDGIGTFFTQYTFNDIPIVVRFL